MISSENKTVADIENCGDIEQSDCCGNGCVNCILDVKSIKSKKEIKLCKTNILNAYSKFKLHKKCHHIPELDNVLELHFISCLEMSKTSDYILDVPPGHHVIMRAHLKPDSSETKQTKTILRPYSPYWSNITEMQFKILINLKSFGGPMSYYLANNLNVGDEVEFRGPVGTYEHVNAEDSERNKCIFIISQGVAIAPTLPIVEQVLDNEDDLSRIIQLACFRDLRHSYFRERLQEYNKYWNYQGRIYLAHENCPQCEMTNDDARSLRIPCEHLRKRLRYKEIAIADRLLPSDIVEISNGVSCNYEKVYIVSGTRDFQTSIVDAVSEGEINVKNENIFLL